MKKQFSMIISTAFIILCAVVLSAQEARKEVEKNGVRPKEEKKIEEIKAEDKKIEETIKDLYRRLDIGAKLYLDWYASWGHNSNSFDRVANFTKGSDVSGKNNNSFRVQRAYLDVKYKINDILSARLTTDADASVSGTADGAAAFHMFLKYAYVEAKKDFGPVLLSLSGGLIETPVIGLTDKIGDYRWISQNFIDNSKQVLNNQSLDNSADFGVKGSIGIMKYATLTAAFVNGGGYKANESNSYKAIQYLASINPIKELYINGFGRNEIIDKYDYTGKKAKRVYYGYGIAYSSNIIKVGFNHVFPYIMTVGVASKFNSKYVFNYSSTDIRQIYVYPEQMRGYMLFDSWLNFNLDALVKQAPLLITGRFVYGLQRGTYQKFLSDPECGKERRSILYHFGVGWKFNQNFRIMIGGEIQRYIIKKNSFLRYNEGKTGTEYYNASRVPANGTSTAVGYVYTGSHNPHDAKRIYIKTEVTF